jgi:hypothetical protein
MNAVVLSCYKHTKTKQLIHACKEVRCRNVVATRPEFSRHAWLNYFKLHSIRGAMLATTKLKQPSSRHCARGSRCFSRCQCCNRCAGRHNMFLLQCMQSYSQHALTRDCSLHCITAQTRAGHAVPDPCAHAEGYYGRRTCFASTSTVFVRWEPQSGSRPSTLASTRLKQPSSWDCCQSQCCMPQVCVVPKHVPSAVQAALRTASIHTVTVCLLHWPWRPQMVPLTLALSGACSAAICASLLLSSAACCTCMQVTR